MAVAGALSGWLWSLVPHDYWSALHAAPIAAASCALGLTVLAAIFALALPQYRHSVETFSLALLFSRVILILAPAYGIETADFFGAGFALAVLTIAVHVSVYGRWSESRIRLTKHSERATATTSIKPDLAWEMIVPSPHNEAYWDPTVTQIRQTEGEMGETGAVLFVLHRFPDGKTLEQKLRLTHVKPGRMVRYTYSVPIATNGAERQQSITFTLIPDAGDNLTVEVRWDRIDYPLRRALIHWIDDWAGRSLDQTIARLERREDRHEYESTRIRPLQNVRTQKSDA